ncbi:DUF1259 domain-containing protein [Streptomyces sp. LX-29]|uniref:DUF1259 domain-containing protein n=1 Tax=Streptomyces sp. LX-29 TaxID=2900152 RepID=UPI00240D13EA|nr:DUF1259 domain-containing protein [Streptomyces sp. LX-29]WFB11207.1 DUF1259 domain-containing protein [Streptomyces sp. LX-29]
MSSGDRQRDADARRFASRRWVVAAALAPVAAGAAAGTALSSRADAGDSAGARRRKLIEPVPTTDADWRGVAGALGRVGNMMRGTVYHTGFPRRDLSVASHGVPVAPALALGTHVGFVRYADGHTLMMGDVVVEEGELQEVTAALQEHGIEQTAIHKHLLSQAPDVWWTHVHAHGGDPLVLARGLRAALDRTATPPPLPGEPSARVDLDREGIDAALEAKGYAEDGIYKCLFVRREQITDNGMVLPPGLGSTTAFNFQPLGGGRAALNGDFAMVAKEVQSVLKALTQGGVNVVELHNHGLTDEPRLFFVHIWAVDDAVRLARVLRGAVRLTNVVHAGDLPVAAM